METDWAAIHRMESVADKMAQSADRMEQAVQRLVFMLDDGYGGNAQRLIELLEKANTESNDAKFDAVYGSELHKARLFKRGEDMGKVVTKAILKAYLES